MTIKSIGYAFATSSLATRLKAGATGCYFVETKRDELTATARQTFGPFITLADAETYAAGIDAPWSRYTRRAA